MIRVEVRLIQQGDRGLFIANGNKLLFPDRSWKDAKVGFAADIEITNDKGTYAFVRGRMLETLPIELKNLPENSGEAIHYFKGAVGGHEFILEYLNGGTGIASGFRVDVRVKDGDCVSLERVLLVGRRNSAISYLSEKSKPISMMEVLTEGSQVLNFADDEEYAFEMFKFLQALYDRSGYGGTVNCNLRVYNSSLIVVRYNFTHVSPSYEVYRYIGEIGSGGFELFKGMFDAEIESLWNKSEPLDMTELADLAEDYRVCVTHQRLGDTAFDERLSCKEFEALANGVAVYAFNMNGYDRSWFSTPEAQPYIALVDESFERLNHLKKSLGKTGVGVDVVSKLNLRRWLMPFAEHEE